MTLIEVAYVTRTKLNTILTVSGEYAASLHGLEIVDDNILRGAVGFGKTEFGARQKLASSLCWATVTNGGARRPRNEYDLPDVVL